MVKFRWFIQFAYGNLDLTSFDLLSETERFFENQGALRIIYFGEIQFLILTSIFASVSFGYNISGGASLDIAPLKVYSTSIDPRNFGWRFSFG